MATTVNTRDFPLNSHFLAMTLTMFDGQKKSQKTDLFHVGRSWQKADTVDQMV